MTKVVSETTCRFASWQGRVLLESVTYKMTAPVSSEFLPAARACVAHRFDQLLQPSRAHPKWAPVASLVYI